MGLFLYPSHRAAGFILSPLPFIIVERMEKGEQDGLFCNERGQKVYCIKRWDLPGDILWVPQNEKGTGRIIRKSKGEIAEPAGIPTGSNRR